MICSETKLNGARKKGEDLYLTASYHSQNVFTLHDNSISFWVHCYTV